MTKEEAYDAEVNPLMAKIIEICKREKIAFVASFQLEEDLACTSALLEDEYEPSSNQLKALKILKPDRQPFIAMTITTKKKAD